MQNKVQNAKLIFDEYNNKTRKIIFNGLIFEHGTTNFAFRFNLQKLKYRQVQSTQRTLEAESGYLKTCSALSGECNSYLMLFHWKKKEDVETDAMLTGLN